MMGINYGGSAFPVIPPENATHYPYPDAGMNMRDYFAAHATVETDISITYAASLSGLPQPSGKDMIELARFWASADATLRYIAADAMIAAREKAYDPSTVAAA